MTSSSPIFAPIKRVPVPGFSVQLSKHSQSTSLEMGTTKLQMAREGEKLLSVTQPYIKVEKYNNEGWLSADSVSLNMKSLDIHWENSLDLMKRSSDELVISCKKLRLNNFEMSTVLQNSYQGFLLGASHKQQ